MLYRKTYKQLISDAAGDIEEGIEEALTERRRERAVVDSPSIRFIKVGSDQIELV